MRAFFERLDAFDPATMAICCLVLFVGAVSLFVIVSVLERKRFEKGAR